MPSLLHFATVYLVIVWALTVLMFWHDKRASRINGARRISEITLLQLSFIGGWPAALLARRMFRHKTVKQPFSTYLNIIIILESGLLIAFALLFLFRR